MKMLFKISNIEYSFERHPLLVPFKIGEQPPMEALETIVVGVNGRRGSGTATLANTWAGVELEPMKALAEPIRQLMLGRKFSHPLALYHDTKTDLMKLVSGQVNYTSLVVVAAAYDAAVWDYYGRELWLHPCKTLTDKHLGEDLLAYYSGTGFESVIRRIPRASLNIMYTHGGTGTLLHDREHVPTDGRPNGLIEWCKKQGRKVVKVKCTGNVERDLREILAIHALIGCKLWLDYNGAAKSIGDVVVLLEAIRDESPRVFKAIVTVEQPLHPSVTFSEGNSVQDITALKSTFVDESALDVRDVALAKSAGYSGVVIKTGKGMSASLEMAREAELAGMKVTVQDLTNHGESFGQSRGVAAYLKNLYGGLIEANGPQFYLKPEPSVVIKNGRVKTGYLTGPGF